MDDDADALGPETAAEGTDDPTTKEDGGAQADGAGEEEGRDATGAGEAERRGIAEAGGAAETGLRAAPDDMAFFTYFLQAARYAASSPSQK